MHDTIHMNTSTPLLKSRQPTRHAAIIVGLPPHVTLRGGNKHNFQFLATWSVGAGKKIRD
jgi:hypothetical protein